MNGLTIETEQEEDGRWIGEVMEIPGCLVYGSTREEVIAKVKALALHVIADRIDHGESIPAGFADVFQVAPMG